MSRKEKKRQKNTDMDLVCKQFSFVFLFFRFHFIWLFINSTHDTHLSIVANFKPKWTKRVKIKMHLISVSTYAWYCQHTKKSVHTKKKPLNICRIEQFDGFLNPLSENFIYKLSSGERRPPKKECRSFATGPNQKCLNGFRIRIYQELCDFVFALAEQCKWDFRFIYQICRIMLNGMVTLHGSINRDSLTVNIRPNMHCNGEYLYQFYRKKAFIAIHLLITLQKMNPASSLIAKFKYIHIHFGQSFRGKNQIDSWSRATTQVSNYSWIIRQLCECLR